MKWFTSSSPQYVRWLAMLAIKEISKAPLIWVAIVSSGPLLEKRSNEKNGKTHS